MTTMNLVLKLVLIIHTFVEPGFAAKYFTTMFSYGVDKSLLPTDYTDNSIAEVTTISTMACAVECLNFGCTSAFFDSTLQSCLMRTVPLKDSAIASAYSTNGSMDVFYIDLEQWISSTTTSTSSTTTKTTTTTTKKTTTAKQGALPLVAGDRVTRGPDWEWGDQDGGAGNEGTVTDVTTTSVGWVKVQWDGGSENEYRNGADGKTDLAYAFGE